MNLLNCSNARHYFLSYLKTLGKSWSNVLDINLGRYYLISGKENFGMMFKDDWYHAFGSEAIKKNWIRKSGKLETGEGDCINIEHLKKFIANGVRTIYTVYKTGDIYSISVEKLLEYSHRSINKEGKEVRRFSIHDYTLELNKRE